MYKIKIATRIEPETLAIVKTLCATKGVSVSEYIRTLIIADLDKRSIFSTELKKQLFGGDSQ